MCTQGKTDLRDVSKLVSELKIAVFNIAFLKLPINSENFQVCLNI